MRLRNVKNADIILKNSNYCIDKPESYKGNWEKLFKNDKPIL